MAPVAGRLPQLLVWAQKHPKSAAAALLGLGAKMHAGRVTNWRGLWVAVMGTQPTQLDITYVINAERAIVNAWARQGLEHDYVRL